MNFLKTTLALCLVVCVSLLASEERCGCNKPRPVNPKQPAAPVMSSPAKQTVTPTPHRSACAPAPAEPCEKPCDKAKA